VLLFRFDTINGYRRVFDVKNPPADQGLYELSGSLYFWRSSRALSQHRGQQLLQWSSRHDASSNVVGYVNGVQQFSFVDSQNYSTLPARRKCCASSKTTPARMRLALCPHSPLRQGDPRAGGCLDRLPAGGSPLHSCRHSSIPTRRISDRHPCYECELSHQASSNLLDWVTISNLCQPVSPATISDPRREIPPAFLSRRHSVTSCRLISNTRRRTKYCRRQKEKSGVIEREAMIADSGEQTKKTCRRRQ